jgi:hypothetical protein
MIIEVQKLVQQAVIRYLNGDRQQFEQYANQAHEIYKRETHLYVPIEEILKEKGEMV